MNGFQIKCILSKVLDRFGVLDKKIERLNRNNNNNYIRIVNYHFSPKKEEEKFEKQIHWFLEKFENCNFEKLNSFLNGEYVFVKKPGIIFSFDDGFKENYDVAHKILLKNKATGWYMLSAGLMGSKQHVSENGCHDYMTDLDAKKIIQDGGVIGCHTYSHHRMNKNDSRDVLLHEIAEAKDSLQKQLETKIDIFCWCGGEESTYTKEAAKIIRESGYLYSFMTNSDIVTPNTNWLQMDRSNIEASWSLSLVKFQICGYIDLKLKAKRRRVHKLTKGD